jgi:hypothetical protein
MRDKMALNETSARIQIVLILCDGFQLRGHNGMMTDYSIPYIFKKPIKYISLLNFTLAQ